MRSLVFASFAIAFLITTPGAVAAPQILGLSAFNEPVPLTCTNGICEAELTVFCLQKKRDDPEPGDAYTLSDADGVQLHFSSAQNSLQTVSAASQIRIEAKRGFTAVRLSLAEASLAEFGADRVAVSVKPGISLVPVPIVGDPDPITDRELAFAKQFLRGLASNWLEGEANKPAAARMVNRIINATPPFGRMTTADRRQIWLNAIGDPETTRLASGGALATDMLLACQYRVKVGRYFSLRRCMEIKQDSLMQDMNLRYWKSIDSGS